MLNLDKILRILNIILITFLKEQSRIISKYEQKTLCAMLPTLAYTFIIVVRPIYKNNHGVGFFNYWTNNLYKLSFIKYKHNFRKIYVMYEYLIMLYYWYFLKTFFFLMGSLMCLHWLRMTNGKSRFAKSSTTTVKILSFFKSSP